MNIDNVDYWGRLIKRSVSRFFILSTLYKRPMHGYELRKAIKDSCHGLCDPSDATIYPTLQELLDGGYIVCCKESVGGREKKVCSLTEKGLQAYKAAAEAWSAIIPHLEKASRIANEPAENRDKARF